MRMVRSIIHRNNKVNRDDKKIDKNGEGVV